MGFPLDTNVLSDVVRRPRGPIADRIAKIGEHHVCTSIIVAAELRSGAARKASSRLTAQARGRPARLRGGRARTARPGSRLAFVPHREPGSQTCAAIALGVHTDPTREAAERSP
jgi:PIN domain